MAKGGPGALRGEGMGEYPEVDPMGMRFSEASLGGGRGMDGLVVRMEVHGMGWCSSEVT